MLFERSFDVTREHSVPEWVADAAFYQIFPDRFVSHPRVAKPGTLQGWDELPTFRAFKGGDLLGASEKLEYLHKLGFNAIYLTPIFKSAANHRYHTYDYFEVCPLLGGNDAFRTFVDRAHALKMRVVIDGVFNHASRGFFAFNHVMENGIESPYVDWFHFNQDWLAKDKVLNAFPERKKENVPRRKKPALEEFGFEAWWNLPALPKFNTKNPEVREFIFSVAEHWVRWGVDGWRLDVPHEIDDDEFWREFRQRVKAINPEAYIVGEIWGDGSRWLQGDQFDAVMNYLLGRVVLDYVVPKEPERHIVERSHHANLKRISGKEAHRRIAEALKLYPAEITLAQMNIMTSHDTPRLASLMSRDQNAIRQALGLLTMLPGAPCIYYGDEIAMEGAHDPDCRRAFPVIEPNTELALKTREFVTQLLHFRKQQPAVRRGSIRFLRCSDEILLFARELRGDVVLVCLNRSDHDVDVELPCATSWPKSFVELFSKQKISAIDDVLRFKTTGGQIAILST